MLVSAPVHEPALSLGEGVICHLKNEELNIELKATPKTLDEQVP